MRVTSLSCFLLYARQLSHTVENSAATGLDEGVLSVVTPALIADRQRDFVRYPDRSHIAGLVEQ